jgi:hypothetical protein
MTGDAREAARRSLDPDRLLPGENPESREQEDAAHWVRVYQELKETKETLAADLTAALERSGEAARAELESVDVVLIQFQLQRFRRRLRYWSERQRELSSVSARGR